MSNEVTMSTRPGLVIHSVDRIPFPPCSGCSKGFSVGETAVDVGNEETLCVDCVNDIAKVVGVLIFLKSLGVNPCGS